MDISLKNVTVQFPDGSLGLKDVNLHVNQGEFIALVGPSGSGKTTLLRTLAGFIQPTHGTVTIGGTDMTNTPPEQRQLGMVFQQHAVWPHMSVAKNVAYPLARAGLSKQEQTAKTAEALELVGLAGFQDRKPASLSGGQRQRVALARAVVSNPRVLLLDEALSALDEPLRDSLRRELVSLTKTKGLTTVHVTHDRAEALAVADRVVVLSEGEILQVATPAELLSTPSAPEVAAFITDATVLPANPTADGIEFLGLHLPWSQVQRMPAADSPQLAILPRHVQLDPHEGQLAGTITSVLFSGDGFDVTVAAQDHSFRATSATHFAIGDQVKLNFRRPLAYA